MSREDGLFSNMPAMWWVKAASILVVLIFSVFYTVPTFIGDKSQWPKVDGQGALVVSEDAVVGENGVEYKKWQHRLADTLLPNSRVSLGLDLRGGLHLVLEVDADKSVKDSITRSLIRARDALGAEVNVTDIVVAEDFSATATLSDPAKGDAFKEAVTRQTALVIFDKMQGQKALFVARKNVIDTEKTHVLQQAMNTVRNRIDQFNVAEPNIFQQGDTRVVVQLPGMKEPERAKQLIGNTARLDFRLVLDEVAMERIPDLVQEARTALQISENDVKAETLTKISTWLQENGKISKNAVVMLERKYAAGSDGRNKLASATPYLVEANSRLTGDLVENANADANSGGLLPEWGVSLQFKPQGGKLFGEITTEAFKKQNSTGQIAIILDDNVNSAPNVNEPILNGSARITMGRQGNTEDAKMQEAQDLALVLRAGALPATVRIIEERQVGPSEGEENIRAGVFSSTLATMLVVAFMIWVYGNSGIVANLAMIFNVFIILSFLAAFGATLTLPGIAGITLTLAMAVDGNVIINERIREELRLGLNPRAAFYQGYNMSFYTLLDANLTTAFAGIILLMYGNPAVRGFAVTLLVGIIATVFTSYLVTEVIGQWLVEKTKIKRFA
jgi:preprotein translocase subunit SecD